MATESLPTPPEKMKAVQTYMKIAQDVERVDPVVSYWLRLHSMATALKINCDTPECKTFLTTLMVWLEKFKSSHKDSEMVTNQTVGQAHYENFALTIFNKADAIDRAGSANASTVRMFFMAAILFEAMSVFGSLSEEINQKAKYAKFKAAYIQKCLKAGQTPKPGPIDNSDLEGAGNNPDPNSPDDSTVKAPTTERPEDKASGGQPADSFVTKPFDEPKPADRPSHVPPPDLPATKPVERPAAPAPDPVAAPQPSGPSTITSLRFSATNGAPLNPEDIVQGQKYCKFANSALQYDDIPTAVQNLEKALKLLTTGQRSG